MKVNIHKAGERGSSDLGWLQSRFSFSFADYYNPKRMGFGALSVLNDDTIAPGAGFGDHPHDNMEIITLVTSGALEHKDSTGSKGVIKPGEAQVMSAGTGVVHSEFNHSKKEPVTLFQIWINTKEEDIEPRYDQRKFDEKDFDNKLRTVASGRKEDALYIHQDARISMGVFKPGKKVSYNLKDGFGAFVFLIGGSAKIEKHELNARDSAEIAATKEFTVEIKELTGLMIIEVPL
jgi:quercetin 2,3-dioxygenase